MLMVLVLLTIQGVIGAFDTLYYHEWKARLVARGKAAAVELRIHALRDFLYAVLFASLPWIAWHGWWVLLLAAVLVAEIILTMVDFVVEIQVRKPLGDVYAGERITHAIMAILYGSMLAHLLPVMAEWRRLPTDFAAPSAEIPSSLRWTMTFLALGVFLSGVRDLYATLGLPGGSWPWSATRLPTKERTI